MSNAITPEFAAALINAQGVAIAAESSAEAAKFTALVLGNSAKAFATLAFEDEPAGYAAAMRRNAP
jgi:hypothetical protein